jgi:small-conductance mechanosensitive channel
MEKETIYYLIVTIGSLAVAFSVVWYILLRIGRNPKNILPPNFAQRTKTPLILFFVALAIRILAESSIAGDYTVAFAHIGTLLLIAAIAWFLILFSAIVKNGFMRKFDITAADNLTARRVYTQFSILERVAVFLIVVFAIGAALMSFEGIRAIGVSVFASAGVAGIILGFSAQKAIGTLLAGIQIAITQPIRVDDVVIVEGEWGRIEDIYLTYVVIRIWDMRRLVVPTTYFIEKPFQNWTRQSADLLGTVFIYTDFTLPVEALREELTRLLKSSPLWDGKVNVLQVTDTNADGMEIRALMSTRDSGTGFDLRVYVREKLIAFIQQNYPQSLPKTRMEIKASAQQVQG